MAMTIGLISIGLYIKNSSVTEAVLTYFIGILTIFTVPWNRDLLIIFFGSFFPLFILLILLSSIKLSANIETILTQASNFIQEGESIYKYSLLNKIVKTPTKFRQIGIIDRATTARYLVFNKIPIEQIYNGICLVESLKVFFQIELTQAQNFYRSLNYVNYSFYNRYITIRDMDYIINYILDLPLTPVEFIEIFERTKFLLISKSLNYNEYFLKLKTVVMSGIDIKEINVNSF